MSTRLQANDALEQLAGKTIRAAVILGDERQDEPIEAILIETTTGELVRLETRHGRRESWLEVPK